MFIYLVRQEQSLLMLGKLFMLPRAALAAVSAFCDRCSTSGSPAVHSWANLHTLCTQKPNYAI